MQENPFTFVLGQLHKPTHILIITYIQYSSYLSLDFFVHFQQNPKITNNLPLSLMATSCSIRQLFKQFELYSETGCNNIIVITIFKQSQTQMNWVMTGFSIKIINNCRKKGMRGYAKEAYCLIEDNIAMFHKYTVIVAVSLFILSIASKILTNNEYSMVTFSRLMLYNSSVLFIVGQVFRLLKNWELKKTFTLCILGVETLGYTLMGIATLREDSYNRGISYMIASFLISVAKELNIVHLLVPKNQLKQKRYQFLSSLNSCCAALLFFFGALVSSFWGEQNERQLLSGCLNSFSAVLMSISVYYTIKDQQYQGYSTMTLSMSDER